MLLIPLAAPSISQNITPRPFGVVIEALTVSPAAISLDQRPPRSDESRRAYKALVAQQIRAQPQRRRQ